MTAQDDVRERQMIDRFNLLKPEGAGRSDQDAELPLNAEWMPERFRGRVIPFELKSATGGRASFSTGRDIGPSHISRWRSLHWLFGVYRNGSLEYCLYGSPARMSPWFDEREAYIGPDFALVDCVPALIDDAALATVLGDEASFSLKQARALMKNQYRIAQYREMADLPGQRYSREAMLMLLRKRCAYVLNRGSSLNNPSMGSTFFRDFPRIVEEPAHTLRRMVIEALEQAEPE